jgi:hypothetical protein
MENLKALTNQMEGLRNKANELLTETVWETLVNSASNSDTKLGRVMDEVEWHEGGTSWVNDFSDGTRGFFVSGDNGVHEFTLDEVLEFVATFKN